MTKALTGKLTIIPAGHKVGDDKKPTWYRDENGNYHAEFFKASMGELDEKTGKYHSYTWNVSANDAEDLANLPLGTRITAVVRPKFKTTTALDADGKQVEVTAERVTPSADGNTFYHEVILEDISIEKTGGVPRSKRTLYFADVKFDDGKKTVAADDGTGDDE